MDIEDGVQGIEFPVPDAKVERRRLEGSVMLVDQARVVHVLLGELVHLSNFRRVLMKWEKKKSAGRGSGNDVVNELVRFCVWVDGEEIFPRDGLVLVLDNGDVRVDSDELEVLVVDGKDLDQEADVAEENVAGHQVQGEGHSVLQSVGVVVKVQDVAAFHLLLGEGGQVEVGVEHHVAMGRLARQSGEDDWVFEAGFFAKELDDVCDVDDDFGGVALFDPRSGLGHVVS